MRLDHGRRSSSGAARRCSLYDKDLATYDEGDAFDHASAVGFIEIFGLPLRVEAARHGAVGKHHGAAWTWTRAAARGPADDRRDRGRRGRHALILGFGAAGTAPRRSRCDARLPDAVGFDDAFDAPPVPPTTGRPVPARAAPHGRERRRRDPRRGWVDQLAFLHEFAQLATQARDWDELMRTLVDRTTVAMGVEVCSFYLLDRDGRAADARGDQRPRPGAGRAGSASRSARASPAGPRPSGSPCMSPDVTVDPGSPGSAASTSPASTRCCPCRSSGTSRSSACSTSRRPTIREFAARGGRVPRRRSPRCSPGIVEKGRMQAEAEAQLDRLTPARRRARGAARRRHPRAPDAARRRARLRRPARRRGRAANAGAPARRPRSSRTGGPARPTRSRGSTGWSTRSWPRCGARG